MLSSEAANTSDPPVVDPVTDALAAAIYHVMEQLGQMVGLCFLLGFFIAFCVE